MGETANADYPNHYSKPKPIKFHTLFYYVPLTFHNHVLTLITPMQISWKRDCCIIFNCYLYTTTFRTLNTYFFDTGIVPER